MSIPVKYIAVVAAITIGFLLLSRYVLSEVPGPYWAVLVRCVSLTVNNIVTILCSIYAWKRVNYFIQYTTFTGRSPFISDAYNRNKKYDRREQKETDRARYFKYSFIGFVLMSMSSWYMPYVPLFYGSYDVHWVPFVTYLSLGFLLQFLICLFFINGLKLTRRIYRSLSSTNKRMSYQQGKTELEVLDVPVAVVYALICCAYGLHGTSLPQQIISVDVPVVGLPKSFDGYRIAMLTDIHLGPTVGRKKLEQVVNIVNTMRAGRSWYPVLGWIL